MNIYILIDQNINRNIISVSQDINVIRKDFCNKIKPDKSYPELQVWSDNKLQSLITGNDTLKFIAKEINKIE